MYDSEEKLNGYSEDFLWNDVDNDFWMVEDEEVIKVFENGVMISDVFSECSELRKVGDK